MNLLSALLRDFGIYTAAMALLAAFMCYRANPLRAVNRYIFVFLVEIAIWQVIVALARTTHDVKLWGFMAAPVAAAFIVAILLVYHASIKPHDSLLCFLHSFLPWLTIVSFALGATLAYTENLKPGLYPFGYRVASYLALAGCLIEMRNRCRTARLVNRAEFALFTGVTIHLLITFAVFELVRSRPSSRINTGVAIALLVYVIGMLLSERVLDAGGTARVALGYVIRVGVCFAMLLPLLEFYRLNGGTLRQQGIWMSAVFVTVASFPITLASDWVLRKTLKSYVPRHELEARDSAIDLVGSAETQKNIAEGIAALAKGFLRGLEVKFEVFDLPLSVPSISVRSRLLQRVGSQHWLSPDLAIWRWRGAELQSVVDAFTEARLGAVVKYEGKKGIVALFVSPRAGGSESITPRELNFLYELASIAGAGIDRVRAVDESSRARTLAMVGRAAADFSHSARNQIDAVKTFVEAVRDGQESRLSQKHRDAVYQEILSLAASHAMALEMTRLSPEKIDLRPVAIGRMLESTASAYERVVQNARGRLEIAPGSDGLAAIADERLLRQVLLNLIRNGMQAAAGVGSLPVVRLETRGAAGVVRVEVVDNGPGVPAEIHDRLFVPWTSSKPDGTGLGLAFCLEAMRAMKGEIRYLTERGQANARFRLELPLARNSAAADAGM